MKTSLITLSLACAVISSCQYRPNNFYANKAAESGTNIPSYTPQSGGGTYKGNSGGFSGSTSGGGGVGNYISGLGSKLSNLGGQGSTSGSWDSATSNFVLSNGSTFEMTNEGKVKVSVDLANLEIIELTLTNIYGGVNYSIDTEALKDGSVVEDVAKGTYRINIRNRWEVNANPAPQGTLTVRW